MLKRKRTISITDEDDKFIVSHRLSLSRILRKAISELRSKIGEK